MNYWDSGDSPQHDVCDGVKTVLDHTGYVWNHELVRKFTLESDVDWAVQLAATGWEDEDSGYCEFEDDLPMLTPFLVKLALPQ